MSSSYNTDIANEISSFLEEDDWTFKFEEDRGIFRFGLGLETKMKKIDYIVDVKDNDYLVYAISPLSADENDPQQMKEITEFICRANFNLTNGNFELDLDDGEIRYKCYQNCKDGAPSHSVIRDTIYFPAHIYTVYSPGIIKVLFNGMPGAEAIELCESKIGGQNGNKDEQDMPKYLTDLLNEMQESDDSSEEDEE